MVINMVKISARDAPVGLFKGCAQAHPRPLSLAGAG